MFIFWFFVLTMIFLFLILQNRFFGQIRIRNRSIDRNLTSLPILLKCSSSLTFPLFYVVWVKVVSQPEIWLLYFCRIKKSIFLLKRNFVASLTWIQRVELFNFIFWRDFVSWNVWEILMDKHCKNSFLIILIFWIFRRSWQTKFIKQLA